MNMVALYPFMRFARSKEKPHPKKKKQFGHNTNVCEATKLPYRIWYGERSLASSHVERKLKREMYTYKNMYTFTAVCVRMSGQFVLKIDRMERNFVKEKKLYFIRYNTTKRMWNVFYFLEFDILSYFSLHEELFGHQCTCTLYNEFLINVKNFNGGNRISR